MAPLPPTNTDLSAISLLLHAGGAEPLREIFTRLMAHGERSAQELADAQLRHVTRWFPAIAHGVPAYRTRLERAIARGERLTWEDFRELPILTRAELQEAGSAFECREPPPAFRPIAEATTSGSTGRPLVTKACRATNDFTHLLRLRFLLWQRFDLDATCAFITSPTAPAPSHPKSQRLDAPWAAPLGKGPSRHLSLRSDVGEQLAWLLRTRPRYLVTYPSNLLALLKESEERRTPCDFVEAITLSSEPVSSELVELCRELWGARVVATYSASETGLLATQVPEEEDYLVQVENVILEVLRDDGSPCGPGEVGRVVVTTLHDLLRPLVRYEGGDYAEVGAAPAPSSPRPGFPRLRRIVGRERSMVRLPDGRRIWPYFEFAPLIELGAVEQWQLVQRRDGTLTVRLVTKRSLTGDEEGRVRAIVEEAVPGVPTELEYVERIERTAGGKYLEFVSEL